MSDQLEVRNYDLNITNIEEYNALFIPTAADELALEHSNSTCTLVAAGAFALYAGSRFVSNYRNGTFKDISARDVVAFAVKGAAVAGGTGAALKAHGCAMSSTFKTQLNEIKDRDLEARALLTSLISGFVAIEGQEGAVGSPALLPEGAILSDVKDLSRILNHSVEAEVAALDREEVGGDLPSPLFSFLRANSLYAVPGYLKVTGTLNEDKCKAFEAKEQEIRTVLERLASLNATKISKLNELQSIHEATYNRLANEISLDYGSVLPQPTSEVEEEG
jgi:hypothetical protein